MDSQKVDIYIMSNSKYFDSARIPEIRARLLEIDDAKWIQIQSIGLKDPTTSLIVSLLAGNLGIDRFLIGDIGIGVGKLLTCGGFGIWTIVDWFSIQSATRKKNIDKVLAALY